MRTSRRILSIAMHLFIVIAMAITCPHSRAARLALVMGNDSYPGNELKNARNDARGVFNALKTLGYSSRLVLDSDRSEMIRSISTFASSIKPDDIVLVYYAGHGLQVNGENFLIPTDFHVSAASQVADQAYSLSSLVDELSRHGASTQVIILDACRNNPFLSSRSLGSNGWAGAVTSAGSFLAFGTSPGSTAADEPKGDHGLFTKMLLRRIGTSSVDIESMFQQVRADVIQESGGSQVPWTASSLVGTLHINPREDLNDEPIQYGTSERKQTDSGDVERSIHEPTVVGAPDPPGYMRAPHRSRSSIGDRPTVDDAIALSRGLKINQAIGILQDIVSITPASMPFRLLGLLLEVVGRHVEAKLALDRAIAINPADTDAVSYRCLVELQATQEPPAESCATALAVAPSSSVGHLVLGMALARQNQVARARAEVKRALDQAPGDPLATALALNLQNR